MIKIPSYIKDYYFLNSYIKFPNCEKLPLLMEARTVTYQMYSDFDKMLDNQKIEYNGLNPAILTIAYNRNLKEDAYQLSISKDKLIYVEASNRRGIRYALDLLGKFVTQVEKDIYLPIIRVDDEPSFKYRGIIEGFFGKPWSHDERIDEINLMSKYRLNTFIYAPKDDEYHRKLWRTPYPEAELKQLIELKSKCDDFDIDFYYTISPGLDFNYNEEKDFSHLFAKLDQVIGHGIKYFGILMDDIDYQLKGPIKQRFNRPGIAHAYICNRVNSYLQNKLIDYQLIMCPTEYHQNNDSVYRHDLASRLDANIAIFFTGDNVCAEVMIESVVKKVQQDFDHPLFIWENHPVNDFIPNRIFTGPIGNRSRNLPNFVDGYITNPMNQWLASKVGIISCAYYAWDSSGYQPEVAFCESLNEFSDLMPDIQTFFEANRATVVDHYHNMQYKLLNNKKDLVINYYEKLKKASINLLKQNHPLILEIKPWLEKAVEEAEIVNEIYQNKITHERLITSLSNPIRLGIELLDDLIKEHNLLTVDEYREKVIKPRGNLWWRIWEDKR